MHPDNTLCLRKRLEELCVPRERPDAETPNLSKRFLNHKVHDFQRQICIPQLRVRGLRITRIPGLTVS